MKPIYLFIGMVVLLSYSGCIGTNSEKKIDQNTPISTASAITSPTQTSVQPQDSEALQQLETRIKRLESQASETERIMKYNGMMKQSEKKLIPEIPFKLVVCCGKNKNYLFLKDGIVEVTEGKDPIPLKSTYIIFYENNTIKIRFNETNFNNAMLSEDIYQDFRLRLFDDYVASVYENDWIRWVSSYTIDTNATNMTSKWEEMKK